MVDMSQFIAARSDQLNADDLMDSPRTITITKVTAQPDTAEQPVSIHYENGEGRVFKPCKTVRRIMVGVWGKNAADYAGRSMTLYRDPTVAFGGMQVGGIRVSHMSHIDAKKTVALQVTRGRKAPFTILPLEQPASSATPETTDHGATLTELEAVAGPGQADALAAAWGKIGKEARKALADELPRLKSLCASVAADEPTDDALAPWLKAIEGAGDLAEVDRFDKESEVDRAFMTDEQTSRLGEALAVRRAALRETAPAAPAGAE